METSPERDYWPTDGWHTAPAGSLGVDPLRLSRAVEFVRRYCLPLHSLLVVRRGRIAVDVTFDPFTPDTLHDLASCSKSVTATLVGIAIDQGKIAGPQQPVTELLPGRVVDDFPGKRSLTLEHLLTMTSGLARRGDDDEARLDAMRQSDDWAAHVLNGPLHDPPGARFEYFSPGSYLLSAIVQEASGLTALDFARAHLFGPLGIEEAIWPANSQGVTLGWGDLRLKPHDMAKLGYLYLNQGRWEDRQIVSADWVGAATRTHVLPPGRFGYGYQWWRHSLGDYAADGRGGQQIIQLPEEDAVIVLTGGLSREQNETRDLLLRSLVVPALQDGSPGRVDAAREERLAAATREAAQPRAQAEPVPPPPALAAAVSGRDYRLAANPLRLESLSLRFSATDEARLHLQGHDGALELPVGLDNVPRGTREGRLGIPAAATGWWTPDDRFVIEWDEIGNINRWQLELRFSDQGLTLRMQEPSMGRSLTIEGTPTSAVAG